MLVISRKAGESLVLSDNIKITVISTANDKVVIGIDAKFIYDWYTPGQMTVIVME